MVAMLGVIVVRRTMYDITEADNTGSETRLLNERDVLELRKAIIAEGLWTDGSVMVSVETTERGNIAFERSDGVRTIVGQATNPENAAMAFLRSIQGGEGQ
jgi:hypothetical protein